ncbi:unnamed protein product, partial [Closterium sp. NIES-54]
VWGSRGVSGENGAVLRGGGVLRPAQPVPSLIPLSPPFSFSFFPSSPSLHQDLSKLNRDPNKVIYISSLPESVLQKENLVPLSAWKDTGADTALLDLLPFLECVARQRPADIRVVLQSYEGQDIPTAFKERSKLMQ